MQEHPFRFAVANELHARPFPLVEAPARAAFLALKPAENAAGRDRAADLASLKSLLDHYAAPYPEDGATHYFGQVGKYVLKWESHTEFVTYSLFGPANGSGLFDKSVFEFFPADWVNNVPGARLTSAIIAIEQSQSDAQVQTVIDEHFVPESLAVSRVLENDAIVAGDFRIDPSGHMRFAIFAREQTGARRIGRIVQRLCEIETYKAMAMLGFFRAKQLSTDMSALDRKLNAVTPNLAGEFADSTEDTLRELLAVSGQLEQLTAATSFRFGATGAYEKIVNQRVQILREERFEGQQTFGEFMMRRFDPAMRTVASTKKRLEAMSARAIRASNLLRTRVDVELSRENKDLLESMDRRADLQLKLQKTVEGLSVVAISYYAVNLMLYLFGPLGYALHLEKVVQAAIVTPPVILAVWFLVNRIRKGMH